MKNVTLNVDEQVLERARELARKRSTTLNQLFREWLQQLTSQGSRKARYQSLMQRLAHARSGRRFSREEMNAR